VTTSAGVPDRSTAPTSTRHGLDVVVVGSSFHFMSGLSVYTCRLANAMAADHRVGAILLDRLIPARLYPGGSRAGQDLAGIDYDAGVRIGARIDWWWGPDIVRAVRFLRRERPRLLVLQWWTAATLHTYLVLALAARRLGIPVVVEFHETQDTGEVGVPLVATYARLLVPRLIRLASGALVHNDHDLAALEQAFGARTLAHLDLQIAPHGPYDHLNGLVPESPEVERTDPQVTRLLFFGTIRPYKGLEDLVTVFNRMSDEQVADFRLTVVGETWEGWTGPGEQIEASPHRDRITFVNHYVTDAEAAAYLADTDVMVLPARRGSASGPLQIAMSSGLNVVLYAVGGLVEAARDYAGATLVPPEDLGGLEKALLDVRERRHQRYADPHSWDPAVAAVDRLLVDLGDRAGTAGPA
jgi:glycosyltransferase involved in cell wall biosynthesis